MLNGSGCWTAPCAPGWAGSALGACRLSMYVEVEKMTQFSLLEESRRSTGSEAVREGTSSPGGGRLYSREKLFGNSCCQSVLVAGAVSVQAVSQRPEPERTKSGVLAELVFGEGPNSCPHEVEGVRGLCGSFYNGTSPIQTDSTLFDLTSQWPHLQYLHVGD